MPNLGQDLEVFETRDSLATAQKMYNHKLEMGTAYTRAKWHNPAKDTLYDFHPELDSDIKITHNSARVASGSLGLGGKWWISYFWNIIWYETNLNESFNI